MSSADRTPPNHTELEVRWNQRFFWRNILILVPVFLAYITAWARQQTGLPAQPGVITAEWHYAGQARP